MGKERLCFGSNLRYKAKAMRHFGADGDKIFWNITKADQVIFTGVYEFGAKIPNTYSIDVSMADGETRTGKDKKANKKNKKEKTAKIVLPTQTVRQGIK